MKILLIKPETVGIFSYTYLVEHECLELEYLYTILKLNYDPYIYDRRHDLTPLKKKLKQIRPDIVCITGYITQQPLMIKITQQIKKYNSSIKVIIGGSNAEINYKNYYDSKVDYIYHLSGLENFVKLIDYISGTNKKIKLDDILGICYKQNNKWKVNEKIAESPEKLPIPNREYFYKNKLKYRYLTFHPLALVKNSFSCKRSCSFCFCTNRNSGRYAYRSVGNLVNEIKSLNVPNIHITDDDFLVDRDYLKEFIELIKKNNIKKKYLVYGRADFIANNEDIMKELSEIGLSLVMVGLESTDNNELDSYNKKTTVNDNEECIRILNKYNIICAGLFIVHQEMTKQDFKDLYNWIASKKIMPTISIFTPMQGSAIYKKYESEILDKNPIKQDLFHCILKPRYMSVGEFTREYYKLSLKLAWKNRKEELYSCVNINSVIFVLKVLLIKLRRIFIF